MPLKKEVEAADAISDEDILDKVVKAANESFDAKVALIGQENFTQFERMVLLQSIDTHWREHLASLDYLRQGIHLRGYAQKQPKQEYKREAFELFGQLLDSVKNEVTRQLMTVRVQSGEQLEEAAEAMESRGENVSNITYSAPTETGEVEVRVDEENQRRIAAAGLGALSAEAAAFARVGRNDPCPCGSGKKYKHCHGKLS
jgi:preprotein translocase subunit SecA